MMNHYIYEIEKLETLYTNLTLIEAELIKSQNLLRETISKMENAEKEND